jgi:Ca2+-binding RTX toxin-like protein
MPKPQEPGKSGNAGKPTDKPVKAGTIEGTSGNDTLKGTDGNDLVRAGAGNDVIEASYQHGAKPSGGHDKFYGGAGDDRYKLTADSFGQGDFRITELKGEGHDTIELVGGDARFKLPDHVEDLLAAKAGKVNVTGNALGNRMEAGSGASRLDGGAGDDVLVGGAGNDVLIGGAGSDRLTGGAGGDIFLFQKARGPIQNDVITDFNFAAGDRIVLHGPHSYTVSISSAGNAVLTIYGGNTIELVGVKEADVAAAWFEKG